jgi:hypothetical protein
MQVPMEVDERWSLSQVPWQATTSRLWAVFHSPLLFVVAFAIHCAGDFVRMACISSFPAPPSGRHRDSRLSARQRGLMGYWRLQRKEPFLFRTAWDGTTHLSFFPPLWSNTFSFALLSLSSQSRTGPIASPSSEIGLFPRFFPGFGKWFSGWLICILLQEQLWISSSDPWALSSESTNLVLCLLSLQAQNRESVCACENRENHQLLNHHWKQSPKIRDFGSSA